MTNLDKIATHPLQSSAWAEFRRQWGNEVLETKYGLLTIHHLPFTSYKIGVFEKGPTPTSKMLNALRLMGKKNNLIFIKLEPNVTKSVKLVQLVKSVGAVPGKTLFTPTTFWIDLKPTEEKLLKSFSSKTRYNIRLAQKHGVVIKIDNSDKSFNRYLELTKETVNRQGFYAHNERYHRLMWKHLHTNMVKGGKKPIANLITAVYKKSIITTWILFVWNDFLYYPYGASTEKFKNIMANNLMMWEAVKFGKDLGLKTFDLWGREEGKGFTKFKEGYNPKVIEFLGTWDLIINKPLYYLYRVAEQIRWHLLKFSARVGLSMHKF